MSNAAENATANLALDVKSAEDARETFAADASRDIAHAIKYGSDHVETEQYGYLSGRVISRIGTSNGEAIVEAVDSMLAYISDALMNDSVHGSSTSALSNGVDAARARAMSRWHRTYMHYSARMHAEDETN